MKVLAILCVALFAGAVVAQEISAPEFVCEGNVFLCKLKEIAHHVSFHASKLGNTLLDVGSNILASALDQGKNLLTIGSQTVLGTVLEHMDKSGLGKREISDGFFAKVQEHFSSGVEFLKNLRNSLKTKFETAVNKLTTTLKEQASLKGIEDDAMSKVDAIVAKFKEAGKGGFLQMAATIGEKIRAIWSEALAEAKALSGEKTEKRALLDLFNSARDGLSALTGQLADTFRPHLDALTGGVQSLADQLKVHGTNLVASAKDNFDALKGKLTGHLDTLKGHASTLGDHAANALTALKDAVTSILTQTATNVSGTVGKIVDTGIDASKVVGDHVVNAVTN